MINHIVKFFNKLYKNKLEEENKIDSLEPTIVIDEGWPDNISKHIVNNTEFGHKSPTVKTLPVTNINNNYAEYIAENLDNAIKYNQVMADYAAEKLNEYNEFYTGCAYTTWSPSASCSSVPYGSIGSSGTSGRPGTSGTGGYSSWYSGTSGDGRDWNKPKKEIKRVYSELDPYGEEDWDEN